MSPAAYEPANVVRDLKELRELTGGPDGARRLAWTDDWVKARDFLRAKLDDPFAHKLLHTVRGMGYVLEDRAP